MLSPFKFEEGYQSGSLTVVDRFVGGKQHNTNYYTVKCPCNLYVNYYITEEQLASGKYTSCPLCEGPLPKLLSHIGNRFNDLLVVGITFGYSDNKVARINTFGYMLKCVCGTMFSMSYKNYINTNKIVFQSCGCKKYAYLIGNKRDKLTILDVRQEQEKSERYIAVCQCKCGRSTTVPVQDIIKHRVGACEECTKKIIRNKSIPSSPLPTPSKHINISPDSKLIDVWRDMHNRCSVITHPKFGSHARNKVCDEWKDKYVFCDWALKNGYKDGYTIGLKNHGEDYSPDNCIWIPIK